MLQNVRTQYWWIKNVDTVHSITIIYYILNYKAQNKTLFLENAKKHTTMNRPNVVNKVIECDNNAITDMDGLLDTTK